jgi:ketosteroid isomerase-like protein
MSQGNVEVMREGIAAWSRNDLDEWLAVFAPDAEWHTTGRFADRGVYRGREALARYWAEFREDVEELGTSVSEIRAIDDKVLVAATATGRGKRSKAGFEVPGWFVTTFRHGLVVRVETYDDPEQALAAVGLRKSAMSQENLDLVQRVVDAVNERDVDGYLACCADDIKLRTPWAGVEGVYEGPEAIRRFFADLQDWAPDFRLTIERVEPVSATRALVFLRASLSGRASGLPAVAMSGGLSDAPAARDLSTATVYDFAGGEVTSIRVFLDRNQALEAVGLRE